jgi:hypothetical protein
MNPTSLPLGAAEKPLVILVINRWDDDFALYGDYIDHDFHQVVYLTTAVGRIRVPVERARSVFELEPDYTKEQLLALSREVVSRFGRIDRIIAMSEYDLPKAAFLRDELGVPGPGQVPTRLLVDKVAMKQAVQAAGLRAPRYVECKDIEVVMDFAAECGCPLILKPKVGAASHGVHAVLSRTALAHLLHSIDLNDYECEEFIPGTIMHADGIVCEGELGLCVASRYINNCLAFNSGVPLGSVFVDDEAMQARILRFTARALETLNLRDGAFHLELIHSESDELVFLEINARVGGAEITFLMRDLFEIDLVGAWVRQQVDGRPHLSRSDLRGTCGGWLLIPEPDQIPSELEQCSAQIGKVPHLYKEILPAVGHVFRGDGGYENIAGRYRFSGPNSAAVERSIYAVLAGFDMRLRRATS